MSKELPSLFSRDAKGKLREWRVFTRGPMVFTQFGIKGGKMVDEKYAAKAKNLGRANQTNAEQQAEAEAASMFQKKLDEGYDPDPAIALTKEVFLPMLAKRADKVMAKLKWPMAGQRKYNGMRCMSRIVRGTDSVPTVELFSRLGERLVVPHVEAGILGIGKVGDVFDGEFYTHGIPLQTIVSLVKNNRPESAALQYYLYDMPKIAGDLTAPWASRWQALKDRFERRIPDVKSDPIPLGAISRFRAVCLAETTTFYSAAELDVFERQAIADGFEGVMLREMEGLYRLNVRSSGLLKVKRYQDAEFAVIDAIKRFHHGIGADIVDCFVLQNDRSEHSFKAVPVGSIESRKTMWEKRDDYLGKNATVRFFERSIDLIPIGNPTFRGLRDAIDGTGDDDEDGMWTNKSE